MNFFDKHKKSFICILAVICIALGLYSAHRYAPTLFEKTIGVVLTPVTKAFSSAGSWVGTRFSAVTNINSLIDENALLKAENEELMLKISEIDLLEEDNKRLTELFDLSQKYNSYKTTGARIIAKDPGNWYNTFVIDKGTRDGLDKNMSVISQGGLVGRISECGPNYSKVISIIDDGDAVSAMSIRTGDTGYIKGDYSKRGMCKMELIDSASKITEGDEIITSSFSTIYPEGIPIGKVASVANAEDTSTKTASVTPNVDFKHLSTVLIITSPTDQDNAYTEEEALTEETAQTTENN